MKFKKHKKGKSWQKIFKNKLWKNQQCALDMALDYLSDDQNQQAMVRMPTGTGKTGVIAILSQLITEKKKCVVVAPFTNLVSQLKDDITTNFWAKIDQIDGIASKKCEIGKPSNFLALLQDMPDTGIIVCTYQALTSLKSSPTKYAKIRDWVDLVLVDEGHREPANSWAKAVRSLNDHIILFTATPYRNDLLFFHISEQHFYSYTYVEADEDKIVRNVEFVESKWEKGSLGGVNDFIKTVTKETEKIEKKQKSEIKVIIRCDTAESIKVIVQKLQELNTSVIGIHQRFSNETNDNLKKHVPKRQRETNIKYWVHQWKLLEGLDDDSFQLVAIYEDFKNGRNLVQQIGRVIRNPDGPGRKTAKIITNSASNQKELWSRFKGYEENVKERREQGCSELKVFEDFVASISNTPVFYFLGDFRKQLSSKDITDPRAVIEMKKSVLLRRVKKNFKFDKFISRVEAESFSGEVARFGDHYLANNTYLQLYQTWRQSVLVKDAFLENKLGYVFAKLSNDILVFCDSAARVPECFFPHTEELKMESLRKLLPENKSTIKVISLINGDFGKNAFRSQTLSTSSLRNVPPSLSDYASVCSTAIGAVEVSAKKVRRRYVGFTKGRASERTKPVVNYNKFAQWLRGILQDINNKKVLGDSTLSRFAEPARYDGSDPIHILFDLDSERIDLSGVEYSDCSYDSDEFWLVKNWEFTGEIDDKYFIAKIRHNKDNNRFELDSTQLRSGIYIDSDGQKQQLLSYLNNSQEFRILLKSQVIYTQGKYFKPNQFPWRGGGAGYNLKNILHECSLLKNTQNEKGNLENWATNSVFGAIVKKSSPIYTKNNNNVPDFLVCYDVTKPTEFADFFALYLEEKRIVMIHAKHSKNGTEKSASASAFYDVCGQAVRYLGFFNPTDTNTKLSKKEVEGSWCPDKNKYAKQKRLVWTQTGYKAAKVVKAFNDSISDPTFNREVWIVMGKGVSKGHFDSFIDKLEPKANEKELCLLLQSTWCATAAVGAELKVFCMP